MTWVHKFSYPRKADMDQHDGVVEISVTVDSAGHASDCEVVRSSGSELLDRATCEQYEKYAHFTPATNEYGEVVASRANQRFRWPTPNNR